MNVNAEWTRKKWALPVLWVIVQYGKLRSKYALWRFKRQLDKLVPPEERP